MDNTAHSILVMDDERIMRNLVASILPHLGYNVTTCADGEEAIRHYKTALESGKPFFAAIMDLVVYGVMNGLEVGSEILRIDPQAKLIACSGHADDQVMTNPQLYGFQASIPKPYTLAQMEELLVSL